ncbi:MAG: AbrB/MazE/SpoVT family DNA-binding domain-containing protein [Candidatus Moranbacteria bacterium]|nr:AbrB/MazE/SpoVT family DNA-binding domain-containing protein [Candidatus Moranbacteria bacterium]
MRRKLADKSIRKIYKKSGSYGVTIPIEIIKDFKIKEGQKVVVKASGKSIVIVDWKK